MSNSRIHNRAFVQSILVALALCLPGAVACAVNKNGLSPNVVALPQGPGTIAGLGEEFDPSLSTGTANYSVPLFASPGVAGYRPILVLEYDSGSGNGPLGYGWTLETLYVQRKTSLGIPRYIDAGNGLDDDGDGEIDDPDELDDFVSHIGETLIPRGDGFFFSQTQEEFIRFERVNDYWESIKTSGTRFQYGKTTESRVYDPETGRVFKWLVDRRIDVHGNETIYRYKSFPGPENTNQTYLSRIEYGPGAEPWDSFQFVAFEYEERPDWFETGRAGFIVRTGMRLKEIFIGTQGVELPGHAAGDFNGDGIDDTLNRAYELSYDASPHWSLLTSIAEVGADRLTELPPLTFEYTICNPLESLDLSTVQIRSLDTPLHLMDNESVDLTDLNSDGLPDILKTEAFVGQQTAYLNQGEVEQDGARFIQWGPPTPIGGDERAWAVNLAEETGAVALLADIDADGRSDLVYKAGVDVYYFSNEPGSESVAWGTRKQLNTAPGQTAPAFPFETDDARIANVNGDKRADIFQSLWSGSVVSYRYWINLGGQRWAKSATVDQDVGFLLSDGAVHLEDFNGDNLFDVIRVTPTGVEVTAGLGYAHFAPPIFVPLADYTLEETQRLRAKFQDLDGNGLVDLVIERAAPGEVWYWLNLGNYTFDERRILTGLPAALSTGIAVRWADMNGNGTDDLVYADPRAEDRLRTFDVGELIGCVPNPNLLTSIDNGIGRKILLEYESSTRLRLEDKAAGRPWTDPFPLIIDVITKVTTEVSSGGVYVKELSYHDPYLRPTSLKLNGFGRAEAKTFGDETAPTLISRFEYDVGRDFFQLRGKILKRSEETEDGAVFWVEDFVWEPVVLYTDLRGRTVVFPKLAFRGRDVLEQGAGTPRRTEMEFEYDEFGNLVEERDYGIVENGDRSAYSDERITITEFAENQGVWQVASPSRIEIRTLEGEVVSRKEMYYDDETFSAENFGEIFEGDLTMERDWIDPSDPEAYIETSRIQYDDFGNAIHILDPLADAPEGVVDDAVGHYRIIEYDGALQTYPLIETIHIGGASDDLAIHVMYDEGHGVVTEATRFNDHTTRYSYDPLGRLKAIVRPGDTQEFPTAEFDYRLAVPVGASGVVNYVETRMLDREPGSAGDTKIDHYHLSRSFVDGLGRELMEKEEAERDPLTGAPRVAVSKAITFNARATIENELRPFYSAFPGDTLDELLAYEDIGGPNWRGIFEFDGELVNLGPEEAHRGYTRYDALGRTVSTIAPDGAVARMRFEPLVKYVFDENDTDADSPHYDTPVIQYVNGLGRVIQIDELARLTDNGLPSETVNRWSTRYDYRADGLITRVTDAQGNQKIVRYDGLGRKIFLDDVDRGTISFAYDAASNVVETVDANGQRRTLTYDGANRLVTEDYHDEDFPFSSGRVFDPALPQSEANRPDVAYFYDTPTDSIDIGGTRLATASNVKGHLSYVSDLSGEEHISYDERGRVHWIVKRIPDPITAALVSYKTEMTYDSQDRLVELTYPDEDRVTYEYNDRQFLERISGGATANGEGLPYIVAASDYTPSGESFRTVYGNGIESRFGHDSRGRISSAISAPLDDPLSSLIKNRYTFDKTLNIRRIDDLRPESVVPAGDARRNTQVFSYDDLYRLTSAKYSFSSPGQAERNDGVIVYRYDKIGNMLAKTSTIEHDLDGRSITHLGQMSYGGAAGTMNRVGRTIPDPGPHALTATDNGEDSRTLIYDSNGNVTRMDDLEFEWDFKDRMVSVESESTRAEYTYDYTGRRIVKKVWNRDAGVDLPQRMAKTTQYIGKHFEIRDFDQPTKYVFSDGSRVAKIGGTLEPDTPRIQRMRVSAGWNLLSMAVDADDASEQLGVDSDPNIEAMFVWNPGQDAFERGDGATALPAGSVFWLYAAQDAALDVLGGYSDPDPEPQTIERGFNTFSSLESMPVATLTPPSANRSWSFDAQEQTWRTKFDETLDFLSDLPPFVGPGTPLYIHIADPAEIELPPPEQRVLYYHQDHLGSTSILADASGNVVDETAYYPFGEPRNRVENTSARGILPSAYLFSQKEYDAETGLYNFEARMMAGVLGRFTGVDPIAENPNISRTNPQLLNSYAYALNNPLIMVDPSGELPSRKVVRKVSGEVFRTARGAVAGAFSGAIAGGFFGGIKAGIDSKGSKGRLKKIAKGILKGVTTGFKKGGKAGAIAGFRGVGQDNDTGLKAVATAGAAAAALGATGATEIKEAPNELKKFDEAVLIAGLDIGLVNAEIDGLVDLAKEKLSEKDKKLLDLAIKQIKEKAAKNRAEFQKMIDDEDEKRDKEEKEKEEKEREDGKKNNHGK